MNNMRIGDSIQVYAHRQEANFDRACDEAFKSALCLFGIDEDGDSTRVAGWKRYSCRVDIAFNKYVRMGCEHCYSFTATTVKVVEDEEDEDDE
jgi:hypothetical protein